jgi:large subunit ribosomal protein L16
MGKGKGGNEGYVCVIKPGRVIFELEGVPEDIARKAFQNAHHKLPLNNHVISRESDL